MSELEIRICFKSGYFKSPLGYKNVDWFVDEINKLKNEMNFYFSKFKKDIIMTKVDKEDFENINNCRFSEKEILSDKVRDHYQLTGKNRGPAHSKCNFNVKQYQSIFNSDILHSYSNYDCHLCFK